jgi:hypothetical protein
MVFQLKLKISTSSWDARPEKKKKYYIRPRACRSLSSSAWECKGGGHAKKLPLFVGCLTKFDAVGLFHTQGSGYHECWPSLESRGFAPAAISLTLHKVLIDGFPDNFHMLFRRAGLGALRLQQITRRFATGFPSSTTQV